MKEIFNPVLGRIILNILMTCLIGVFMSLVRAESISTLETGDRGKLALQQLPSGLSDELIDQLALGRSFFSVPWVAAPAATRARDGLGPLFNGNACVACHQNLGGGSAIARNGVVDRSIVFRLSPPDSAYGEQLAINAIHGVPFEAKVIVKLNTKLFSYADGDQVELKRPQFSLNQLNYGKANVSVNPRRSPTLIGLGLIEQIPEEQIRAFEDVDDADKNGVSGKASRVWSYQHDKTTLGRLGWKASSVSTIEQTAKAAINDMGLTSSWFPEESCSIEQAACLAAYGSKDLDLPYARLLAISEYLNHLRLPKPGNLIAAAKALFKQTGCQSCHRSNYQLDNGINIYPYSDFLLHDMGIDLADSGSEDLAHEWRTPPLWGIGIAKTLNPDAGFLHDGRATTLEQAILWHGGEAEKSRKHFIQLPKPKRQLLINFLENL